MEISDFDADKEIDGGLKMFENISHDDVNAMWESFRRTEKALQDERNRLCERMDMLEETRTAHQRKWRAAGYIRVSDRWVQRR